ncbi:MAG: aKG-HExxH-type peptide beta-hydroxylase [Terriglobia bacterium]
MIAESQIYSGFSCPQVGLEKDFLDLVITEYARQSVQKFIECYGGQIQLRAGGIRPVLSNWLQCADTFETVWNSAFGEVFAAVFRNGAQDIERCAALLALRLHECGHEGEWGLQLSKPVRFRFDRWLLPAADAMEVSAMSQAVTLNVRTADIWQKAAFQRSENGWETNYGVEVLPVLIRPRIRWTLLTAESLAPSSSALLKMEVLGYGDADVDTQPELLLHSCDTAMSLIAEFADIYLAWVSNVIRELVPLRARPGMFNNGSSDLSPGVICVSNAASNQENPWSLAEVFVHEATHQYLYIARRLGRMDDGKDTTLYFSPFRNAGRPIYNILITYHAFANVVLFYRTALSHGLRVDQASALAVEKRMKELEQKLQPLEQALESTTSLTPLGLALWEPLREQLAD